MLAPLPAQIEATYVTFGTGCPGTGTGIGAGTVVPAAYANAFGGSNNVFGFSGTPSRYQQVFAGSELPNAITMTAVGLRWDNQSATSFYGAQVDLEIHVGYTTKTPTTLSSTFAANFDSGAPVTVLPRSIVTYPDNLNPPATDPRQFQLVIPWATTFTWTPTPGLNLLIEVLQRGNNNSPGWVYVFDCGWSQSTARLYGNPDTASTGSLDGFGYGYMMSFYALTNTAVPLLSSTSKPTLANTFRIDLGQAAANSSAVALLGLSNTNAGSYTLPLDLGFLGAPGCLLLCSPDDSQFTPTSAQGLAHRSYNIPNNFGLLGMPIWNQFLVLDPTANALGFVASNGGAGVVGT
jgi:hypothetical protein